MGVHVDDRDNRHAPEHFQDVRELLGIVLQGARCRSCRDVANVAPKFKIRVSVVRFRPRPPVFVLKPAIYSIAGFFDVATM